jgi:hypothetical protein
MRRLAYLPLALAALAALSACGSDEKTVVVTPPSQPSTVVVPPPASSGTVVVPPSSGSTVIVPK